MGSQEKRTEHAPEPDRSDDVDDQDPTGPKRTHRDSGNPGADREFLQDLPPVAASAVEDGPAGHGGADSGAADAVRVDPSTDDEERPSDEGEHNDAAGVGPRPPDRDDG